VGEEVRVRTPERHSAAVSRTVSHHSERRCAGFPVDLRVQASDGGNLPGNGVHLAKKADKLPHSDFKPTPEANDRLCRNTGQAEHKMPCFCRVGSGWEARTLIFPWCPGRL